MLTLHQLNVFLIVNLLKHGKQSLCWHGSSLSSFCSKHTGHWTCLSSVFSVTAEQAIFYPGALNSDSQFLLNHLHQLIWWTADAIYYAKFINYANHTATRYYEFRDYSNLDSPAFSDFVSEECSKRLSPCQNVDDYADSMFSIFQDSMDKFAPPSIRKSSVNNKKQYKYDANVAEVK